MALKTFVKINSVTNLSDARYCAGMGVDQLGFNIDPNNTHYITEETLSEITGWVAGIEVVAEVGTGDNSAYDIVEFNAFKANSISNVNRAIIQLTIKDAELAMNDLKSMNNLEYVLLQEEGELDISKKERINNLASHLPIVLGFGIDKDNINALLDELNIKGIALSGSDEIRPGFKDYDMLADILEEIEVD